MSKVEFIDKINSYLGDGFVQFPANIRTDLEVNNVTLSEFRSWVDLAQRSLSAISKAQQFTIMPEGILGSITSNIEGIRNSIPETEEGKPDPVNNFATAVNYGEQLISQIAPYLNLIDSIGYRSLTDKIEQSLSSAENDIDENKRSITALNRSAKSALTKSQDLLNKVSSGVLSQNFGNLSNSSWNWALMVGSAALSTFAFIALLKHSNELTQELVKALQKGHVDYGVFLVKWSLSIPYLILLAISLLELRSRIRLRDTYIFREKVAGSLDGYTEILLDKAGSIRNEAERGATRRAVIQFMIQSMLELTKTPSVKDEKQKFGIKAKDIIEADFSSE